MEPRIADLMVRNFRALRYLEIKGLGRVNLITGRNNTGKSSVLEALRILASNGAPESIRRITQYREEDFESKGLPSGGALPTEASPWLSLFTGFPTFSAAIPAIEIEVVGPVMPRKVTIRTCWLEEIGGGEGGATREHLSDDDVGLRPVEPAMLVVADGARRTYALESLLRGYRNGRYLFRNAQGGVPCEFISPFLGLRTGSMSVLWDSIALSSLEERVVRALQLVEPSLTKVTMVGREDGRSERVAIAKSEAFPRPVPLRSFGDGMNRLFGIALSLVNAKGGFLLIDEFENGLHHTVQTDAWRMIFGLAKELDIQVVATSHSWDAIRAFQEVAAEDPAEGVLVRLTRRGDDVFSTVFREEELAIATREGIEVR